MKPILILLFLTTFGIGASPYMLTIHVGPPSIGIGGSNPLSIPPTNIVDYELILSTPSEWQYRLGLTPILIGYGKEFELENGFFTALGIPIITSPHGFAMGVYSSFGWRSQALWNILAFEIDYTQSLGFTVDSYKVVAPFATRLGFTWMF